MSKNTKLMEIFAKNMDKLKGFKVVCICDDSTSMINTLAYGKKQSRWDELKETLTKVLDFLFTKYQIATDVRFLNNQNDRSNFIYKDEKQIIDQFSKPPKGKTPLTKCLKEVAKDGSNNQLIIIFTDGHPTESGFAENIAIEHFKDEIAKKCSEKVHISIVACTDEDETMKYLRGWDEEYGTLDVVNDFESEKKEVNKATGGKVNLQLMDYIGKILLGSIVEEIDLLDGYCSKD
jgi:hypothetical protein